MRGVVVGAFLSSVALLAACGTEEPDPVLTRQAVGEPVDISVSQSPVLGTIWIDSIRPVTCTEPGSLPPSRGHHLAVTLTIKTSTQYEPHWGWWVSHQDFTTTDPDGTPTGQGLDTTCLPTANSLRDSAYLADSGYQGTIVIDTSTPTGTLVYRPLDTPAHIGAWSWDF